MPKRQKRVKLSKAQILENDTNKWLAKKSAAIDMLCKAMDRLKTLERSHRRLQKAALHPVQKKIADKLNAATLTTSLPDDPRAYGLKPKRQRKLQQVDEVFDAVKAAERAPNTQVTPEDREKRMESLGFRKTGRRKAQPAVTGQS